MTDILVAADDPRVFEEIRSVVEDSSTSLRWVRRGEDVRESMNYQPADLVIADMQIDTMGGIAVAFDLELEADAGRLETRPVLLLLDRRADVFMARRSGIKGWLVKPMDPLRLRRATAALLAGGTYYDESYLPSPVVIPVN